MSAPARRRSRAPNGWRLPLWQVTIEAHTIGRYDVPAQRVNVPASTREIACAVAVKWAHADAHVPPWKPLQARVDAARDRRVRSTEGCGMTSFDCWHPPAPAARPQSP